MYSEKFIKFIEIWQKEFGIEKTIDEKICVDKLGNPIPWYTYPAIEYLSQFDFGAKKIFEFGCGNSSAFWAKRAKKVVSIEDNSEWMAKWENEFRFSNLEIRHREDGESYYNAIFEDEEFYDLIVVDGKCRSESAKAAMQRLNKGGMIILDDSDRVNTSEEYRKALQVLREGNFIQVDFYGFCPMDKYPKNTSLFLSRDFEFRTLANIQPIAGIGSTRKNPEKV